MFIYKKKKKKDKPPPPPQKKREKIQIRHIIIRDLVDPIKKNKKQCSQIQRRCSCRLYCACSELRKAPHNKETQYCVHSKIKTRSSFSVHFNIHRFIYSFFQCEPSIVSETIVTYILEYKYFTAWL